MEVFSMKQISVILIGAGGRGMTYTNIMADLPEQYKVVAVAEPVASRRNHVKQLHNLRLIHAIGQAHLFLFGQLAQLHDRHAFN